MIVLPHKYYSKFFQEWLNEESKLYRKASFYNNTIKINGFNQLYITPTHNEEEVEEIIIADKSACILNYKPSLEENDRLHISITENESDASKVNLKIQIIALLNVENVSGLMILEPEDD